MPEPFSIGMESSFNPSSTGVISQRCEINVSNRISLSRNLATFPFFDTCSARQRQDIQTELVQSKWWQANQQRFFVVDCQRMQWYEQQFLTDLQAIAGLPLSPEMDIFEPTSSTDPGQLTPVDESATKPVTQNRGLRDDRLFQCQEASVRLAGTSDQPDIQDVERVGQASSNPISLDPINLILNGEDHLRIDVAGAGQQLSPTWRTANAVDDALQQEFDFAFHDQFGFLTASPAETGTGLRASVLLHLPALVANGKLPLVQSRIARHNSALREAFGDPAAGDFFRVNNLATLGASEVQLLRQVDTAVQLLVEAETEARQKWLAEEREDLRSKSIQAWQELQVLDFAVLNGPTLDDKTRISILRLLSQWRLGLQMNLLKPNAGAVIAGKFQIVFLQSLLKTAIAKEDYLAASRIRDRIRILGEAA